MKFSGIAIAVIASALLGNNANASDRAEVAGSLAADLLYHCADERNDYGHMDVLLPIIADFNAAEKSAMNVAGQKASFELHGELNLSCDFIVSMVEGVLQ